VFSARGLDVPHADEGPGWQALSDWLGVEASHLWRLRQVHGITAHTESVAACAGTWPEGDLLATSLQDVALAVRTADCVPILYADPQTGAVAAAHAGWRGTVAGAAARMVEVLAGKFGTRPEDLIVAIGPCVGPEAYEVGQAVVDAFATAWPEESARGTWYVARPMPGKYLLDLWTITRDQLAAARVSPANIHLAGLCTVTHASTLHSYRVEAASAGRMVAAIRSRARSA
jgi:YfiH family protein